MFKYIYLTVTDNSTKDHKNNIAIHPKISSFVLQYLHSKLHTCELQQQVLKMLLASHFVWINMHMFFKWHTYLTSIYTCVMMHNLYHTSVRSSDFFKAGRYTEECGTIAEAIRWAEQLFSSSSEVTVKQEGGGFFHKL